MGCNKIFFRKTNISYKEWEKGMKCCSTECRYSLGRVKVKCVICKKEFQTRKYYENKIICCSKECRKIRRANTCKNRLLPNKKGDWVKEKNPRWKPIGTIKNDGHGYNLIKITEENGFKNWVQEHVHVIEKNIGRKLDLKKECVHHINGNKKDNRLENLFLTTQSYHRKLHQSVFMDLINELLKKNIIIFDKEKQLYIVN